MRLNEFTVNTVGMCNLPAGQIDVFGAGVYFQLLNDRYTISWHAEQFDYIARKLCRHTDKVTISFIDLYRNITGAAKKENLHELSSVQKEAIAEAFAATAHACGVSWLQSSGEAGSYACKFRRRAAGLWLA